MKTGDPGFELLFHVGGARRTALALLGNETREALGMLDAGQRPSVADGVAEWKMKGALKEAALVTCVEKAIAISQAFVPRGTLDDRLEENAADGDLQGFRLRNLLALLEESPGSGPAARAARRALSDADPAVRLCGAWESGDAGLPVVEAILADRSASPGIRVQAATLLDECAPIARSCAAARAVLRPNEATRVATAAVAILVKNRDTESLPRILSLLAAEDADVRATAAAALGTIGLPNAEPALRRVLVDSESKVRVAAARALGKIGTVDTVAPLLEIVNSFLPEAALKSACKKSIERIQSRISGAGSGQLALVDDADSSGALSVAKGHETGALSIPENDDAPSTRPKRV